MYVRRLLVACSITGPSLAAAASNDQALARVHPAPLVVDAKSPTPLRNANAHGTGVWLIGALRSVWHTSTGGISQGYAGIAHFTWAGQDGHYVGRRVTTLALGGSTSGFEGRVHSIMALGGGVYTLPRGLAYARVGYELLTTGNARARSSLLAPLLELGHFWSSPNHTLDLGVRLDVPALGSLGIDDSNFRYQRNLDASGYASLRYRQAILDFSLGERRLNAHDEPILRAEGALCGGTTLVLCTRASNYWLRSLGHHVSDLTISVGLGSITQW